MPSRSGTSLIAASAVATPIGMLTKKIQCQLIVSVSTPPSSSPIEPPATATKVRRRSPSPARGLREHGHDHPEDDRGSQRPAHALNETGADQHTLALGESAEQRGAGEHSEADQEDAPLANQVTDPTRKQEQPAECDQAALTTHARVVLREGKVSWIVGRATLTIVASRTIISIPTQRT